MTLVNWNGCAALFLTLCSMLRSCQTLDAAQVSFDQQSASCREGIYDSVAQKCRCNFGWNGVFCDVPNCSESISLEHQFCYCLFDGYFGGVCSSYDVETLLLVTTVLLAASTLLILAVVCRLLRAPSSPWPCWWCPCGEPVHPWYLYDEFASPSSPPRRRRLTGMFAASPPKNMSDCPPWGRKHRVYTCYDKFPQLTMVWLSPQPGAARLLTREERTFEDVRRPVSPIQMDDL